MTAAAPSACYRFGRFELQPDERRLLSAGAPVHVGPHAFDLLVVLAERSGRLITKDELLERVWPKVIVEENTLQVHISALRKVLGSEAIATISGRGYRFTLDVTHSDASPSLPVTPKHNLPQQLTSFVGRENEIAELKALLRGARLLTLTGAGGCGKSRLALQLAADVTDTYPDGVWLVELAALMDQRLVPQTVSLVLGIKEQAGKDISQTLIEHLASKCALLVVDNAEHVLGACAQLSDALLRGCAKLTILCTSRERLGIAGELTYRVPSLSLPDRRQQATPEQVSASESARLFIERARLQRPHFTVTVENAPALASICHRLDGIPLAIELAAPRLRSMSVEEVDRRLDQRFSLLTGGSRTALPRHRTLRSMIDWSYDLLSDAEKATLRRASVFAGGWTLEAAEQVCGTDGVECGEVLDLLASLVDKSLVLAEEHDGVTRYGLLETVRHYARDQLRETGEEARVQEGHLAYFVALAEEAEPHLRRAEWLDRVAVEHDNLRSALAWCSGADGDALRGLQLAGAVDMFWYFRGYREEGRGWLSMLLAAAPERQPAAARAKALHAAGRLAWAQDDYAVAAQLLEESVAIFRELADRPGLATSLNNLGKVFEYQGNYSRARALFEEALAIAREGGDQWGIGVSLNNLGWLARRAGDMVGARSIYEESLCIWRELNNRYAVTATLDSLALVAFDAGDDAAAQASFEESLALKRRTGDRVGTANALIWLGGVAMYRGHYAVARAHYEEGLVIYGEIGNRGGRAMALNSLGQVYVNEGDYASAWRVCKEALLIRHEVGDPQRIAESLDALGAALAPVLPSEAARSWGRVERLREEMGFPMKFRDRVNYDRHVAAARATLGNEAAFDLAWQEGRAKTLEEVVQRVLDMEYPARGQAR